MRSRASARGGWVAGAFRVLIAASVLVHGATASAHAAGQQGAPVSAPLSPVALPDVSRLHPSVQQQLHESYASLTAVEARGDVAPQQRGDAFGGLGMLLAATGFADEAARSYRNAERLAPADFRWPYYLGHVQKDAGDPSGAAESLERARRLRPNDLATLVWLGRVYLDLAQPATAAARLGEALALEPNEPAVRFELGWAALAQQDYARAVEQLTAASALDPEATAVHYPLALAHRGLGDLDRATHHFERRGTRGSGGETTSVAFTLPDPLLTALRGMVRTPQFYRDRGSDAAAAGNWPEAVENLRRAVEAEPGDAATRVNLGTALEQRGDARAAAEQYEEALRLDPGLREAHYGLGHLLERSGRDEEAIARFRAAATEDPTYVAAHLRLGDALRRTDRLDEALAHYREAIALQPADVGARFGEAMALVRLERYAEARDRLTEATRVRPDLSMFRHALARLLAAAPDDRVRDGARAWSLVEALPEEEKHPAVFETMAMVLAELGHFELAIDWQRLAMSATARAGRSDVAQQMADNLALYARSRPCRTPWRDDDPDHRPGPRVEPGLLDAPAPP